MLDQVISIIVPVYNVEKELARCLDSIINQSYKKLEIVIVNDCGTDDSWDIAKDYAKKDRRIVLIDSTANVGLMKAREKGFRSAIGEYLIFVDSDDYLPSDAVESLYAATIKQDVDIVMGNIEKVSYHGTHSIRRYSLSYGSNPENVYKSLLHKEMSFSLCAKLFRTELLQQNEFCVFKNLSMGEDKCLMSQLIGKTKKCVALDKVVYYYMFNGNSITNTAYSLRQIEDLVITHKVLLKEISKYPALRGDLYHEITYNMQMVYCKRKTTKGIKEIICKYDMHEFNTLPIVLKYLNKKDYWVLFKSYLVPRLYWWKK